MECNREEALRAKELAEEKMESKDFFRAKKFALKAKQLFADIRDISQILTVCEVHCCASSKLNGEMNWYRILQVEQTADDSIIKKQYRRLALQLHPDKNKFPGAEEAFKLTGEANVTLLDKAKRSWYDMKIKPTTTEVVSRPRPNQNFTTQSNVDHNLNQEVPVSTKRKVRIDVDDFVNSKRTKKVEVQKKAASEKLPNKNEASNYHNLKQEAPVSTKRKVWKDFDDFLIRKVRKKENIPNEKASNGHNLKQEVPVSAKRKVQKDFDNFFSSKRTKKVEVEKQLAKENLGNEENDHNLKQEIPDFVRSKRTKKVEAEKKAVKENLPDEKESNENEEVQNASSFSCPESEFHDFEKERGPKKFKPGQIWALYDDQDAMPRFYAHIRKVNNPFSLCFTWLEHNPQSELEQLWANEGLPVACGKYRHGTSEVTKNLQMFSHEISWNKGTKRNTFDVYPRKGEVWALFKGRDDNWPPNASNHSKFKYEIIEVVSDCSNGPEFSVIQLVKVEGFVSLFVRSTDKPFQVPVSNILLFSHRVLAYRCSENEKEGVQEGSFKLDTASLPEIFGCRSVENDSSNQSTQGEKKSASSNHGSRLRPALRNFGQSGQVPANR